MKFSYYIIILKIYTYFNGLIGDNRLDYTVYNYLLVITINDLPYDTAISFSGTVD